MSAFSKKKSDGSIESYGGCRSDSERQERDNLLSSIGALYGYVQCNCTLEQAQAMVEDTIRAQYDNPDTRAKRFIDETHAKMQNRFGGKNG